MFDAMRISASGLTAESLRLAVIADNLANQDSLAAPGGAGGYRRQFVVLQPIPPARPGGVGQGVRVAAVLPMPGPLTLTYDPQSPYANAQGYVATANVHLATEMSDLIAASAAYNANATAFQAAKAMEAKALTL
jgi:flagellar basal-body rod protein FlgC